jgi:hypothetical protein
MHLWLQAIVNIYHAALSPLPWPLRLRPLGLRLASRGATGFTSTSTNPNDLAHNLLSNGPGGRR